MKKQYIVLALPVVVVIAVITGFLVMKKNTPAPKPAATTEEVVEDVVTEADPSIEVKLTKSTTKENTMVLAVANLKNKYQKVSYELSYDTNGVVQGVTSRPVDVTDKDTFTRDDIYLGTCSKNVCRPHTGVKKITLVLEFTATDGKKSQLTKDIEI
jgi:uncharacterized protein (UPF0333 family)